MIEVKVTFENAAEIVAAIAGEVFPIRPKLQRKTATPAEEPQTVTADKCYDALSAVDVEAIPTEYVIPSGTVFIDHNGVCDISGYANADVEVFPVLQSKTITPARETQTVEPDADKYGLSAVEVGGIPAEYVVPEGTMHIASNGTHDVSGYAYAEVAVPEPSGQIEITENGTVDVTAFASALVNVAGGGGASNVVTGEFKTTSATYVDIAIPYSGNGYPVSLFIVSSVGFDNNPMKTETRGAVLMFSAVKKDVSVAPTYADDTDNANKYSYACLSKSSDTGTTIASNIGIPVCSQRTLAGQSGAQYALEFRNNKTLRIHKREAMGWVAFGSDTTYHYTITYSE